MEDNLKIINLKYLSNHWSDLPKILNLFEGDQTKIKILKWRRPSMEDDLKTLKVLYLSNHYLYLPQILNLRLGDQTKVEFCLNNDDL